MPRSGSKLHLQSGHTALYEHATFQANGNPALKLSLYVEQH